jgi:two-component system, response regulator PdtaR
MMGQSIRRKVLVVEDEPELRHLASAVIEEADLQVV